MDVLGDVREWEAHDADANAQAAEHAEGHAEVVQGAGVEAAPSHQGVHTEREQDAHDRDDVART